jgi:uncharacterized protein involved in exopolysaccharide biosynthesis
MVSTGAPKYLALVQINKPCGIAILVRALIRRLQLRGGISMSVSDHEFTLQKLEEEKAAIQSRPHDGYADAARVIRLESEIEAIEERIAQEKQRVEYGQG